MGLSLDIPINFDVLLINTFITQLPVVFGELGHISLAGVFERRFVISDFWTLAQRDHSSISRHDLGHWSLLCTPMQCPFRGQSSGLSQLQARDGVTVLFADFKILWLWLLMIDPMFGIQQYDTFTVFLLKILWYRCPTWKCRSRSSRKRLPMLVVTIWSNGGLNHMMFLFRWRFRFALWDDCNCEGAV